MVKGSIGSSGIGGEEMKAKIYINGVEVKRVSMFFDLLHAARILKRLRFSPMARTEYLRNLVQFPICECGAHKLNYLLAMGRPCTEEHGSALGARR